LFITSLVTALGIVRNRIIINTIKPGSIIVKFSILESNDIIDTQPINIVEELKYQLSLPDSNIRKNKLLNNIKSLEVIIKQEDNNTDLLLNNYHIKIYQGILNNNQNNNLFNSIILNI